MSLRNLESVCRRHHKKVKREEFKSTWASIIIIE